MSETQTRPQVDDPFETQDLSAIGALSGEVMVPERRSQASASGEDALMVQIMRHAYERPRDLRRVMQNIKAVAIAMGPDLKYQWPVKNRTTGTTEIISGPTIKCAMMVARLYGNCFVAARVVRGAEAHATHLVFEGRFIDFETGFLVGREFQQRKNQSTGMRDADRQADIVFQIGQSKAIRNAVVNALGFLIDYALEEADTGIRNWIERDPAKAKQFIVDRAAELGVEIKQIEAKRVRAISSWTVADMALTAGELKAIQEGQASVEDLFGDAEIAAGRVEAQKAETAEAKAAAQAKIDGRTKAAREAKRRAEESQQQAVGGAIEAPEGQVPAPEAAPDRNEASPAAERGGPERENSEGGTVAGKAPSPPPAGRTQLFGADE